MTSPEELGKPVSIESLLTEEDLEIKRLEKEESGDALGWELLAMEAPGEVETREDRITRQMETHKGLLDKLAKT